MRPSDVELSRLAVAWGWLDQESFRSCLREADRCQAMGLDKAIDEILLEKQRLTGEQLRKLRRHLGWSLERARIGGFEILRRIGVGGSGSVFEARHVRLNQRVALKVLYPRYAGDRRMTSLFLREARTLARLNHPHLVHAFDGGRDGKYYYLAMEYVDGENLLQRLTRDGPLEVGRSLEIVEAVCGALTALEARHLVHRDIKPANILLTGDGGVKLTDLGLLKVETGSDTPAAEWVCGTPHYLSPEQARGDGSEDTRSDIYSLGATWYHALAGRPPFVGASSREIVMAHRTREPPPLSAFRADVPPAVERTVLGWLSKDPERRPATSRRAIDELGRLSRSVGAPPRPRGSRARRVIAAASVLLACAVVIWIRWPRGSPPESPPASHAADSEVARRVEESEAPPLAPQPSMERVTSSGSGAPEARGAPPPEPPDPTRPDPRSEVAGASPGTMAAREPAPAMARTVDADAPPLPLASIGRALGQRAWMLASGVRGAWEDGWGRLERLSADARGRFEALQPLARGFHARSSVVSPVGADDVAVLLEYDFQSRLELDDFRARPGSVVVEDGDLVAADDPFGTTIESIGWFAPPMRLEGEVSPGTRLTLGLGEFRVSPWSGGRAAERDRASRRGGVPLSNRRPVFELRLDRGGVSVRVSDRTLVGTGRGERGQVPRRGRLSISLEGGRLRWLCVESRLDRKWATERLRLLRELSEDG